MLAVAEHALQTRDAVEGFIDSLNRVSPAAERRIRGWGSSGFDSMRVATVARSDPGALGEAHFLVEARSSFGLDVHTLDERVAPSALSVCLPLAGSMRMRLHGGEVVAQAGGGLIIDPAEVELTQVAAGTHFLEFNLPKGMLLRLGAELRPGAINGAPRFAPTLAPGLSQRLLFIAVQAAGSLQPAAGGPARPILFQRWMELLALTLLDEQAQQVPPGRAASGAQRAGPAGSGGASPAALRRALDFIDAHADQPLLLADIADAACVSASSLLRLFHSQLDQTPVAVLRQVRLDKARIELGRGDGGTVREVARRWGFQNASKFSQAYLRRFGELPSGTRGQRDLPAARDVGNRRVGNA